MHQHQTHGGFPEQVCRSIAAIRWRTPRLVQSLHRPTQWIFARAIPGNACRSTRNIGGESRDRGSSQLKCKQNCEKEESEVSVNFLPRNYRLTREHPRYSGEAAGEDRIARTRSGGAPAVPSLQI